VNEPIIKADNWGFHYFGRQNYSVRHISMEIERGDKVLLLGASGSGKSTLLLGIAGLLTGNALGEEEGRLLIDGDFPSTRRGRSGIVFQDPSTSLVMSRIGDEVAFALENRGIERDLIWQRVNAALDEVGLLYPNTHPSNALSGGEQQRLAIADLLAVTPAVWLLDEPTANLDPVGRKSLIETFFRLQERSEATVILVEHRLTELIEMVNKVVVILGPEEGVLQGEPREIFTGYRDELQNAGIFLPDEVLKRNSPVSSGKDLVIRAENLSAKYTGQTKLSVNDVSVEIRSQQVTAITGSNGSGKTTLALMLASLLKPISGKIEFPGSDYKKPYFSWRAKELVKHVGMVFQEPEHQFLTSNVRKELLLTSKKLEVNAQKANMVADDLMERFRLTELADCNPFTLSGGEKRRLSVATALVTNPELLILDEPTFGQDCNTFNELVCLLEEKKNLGQAIVIVTHDLELIYVLADKIVKLANGSVVSEKLLSVTEKKRSELSRQSDV